MGSVYSKVIKRSRKPETNTKSNSQYSSFGKKIGNPSDYVISDKSYGIYGRLPGAVDGQQFIIRNCKVFNVLKHILRIRSYMCSIT